MEQQDARSLSGEGQEDLRRRVVEAVQKGLPQTVAAGIFGVARGTVSRWMGLVERQGRRALKARRRGRPPVSRLAPHEAATTVRYMSAVARSSCFCPLHCGPGKQSKNCCCESSICRFRCGRWDAICEPGVLPRRSRCGGGEDKKRGACGHGS